jgi:hypothetical protein
MLEMAKCMQVATIEKLGPLVPFDDVAYGIWRQRLLHLKKPSAKLWFSPKQCPWWASTGTKATEAQDDELTTAA